MSFQYRISSIIKTKLKEQQSNDMISDLHQKQPIKSCTDRLFKLIVKLQEFKARQRKQFPVKVRNEIFIGNYIFSSDQQFIKSSNIGLIVSCMSTPPIKSFIGVQYQMINMKDQQGEDLFKHTEKVFNLIQNHLANNQTNVYIHCFHGKSRSVAILMMYLMTKEKRGFKEVLSQIQGIYPLARPNVWFIQQLKVYQNSVVSSTQFQTNKPQENHDLLGFNSHSIESNPPSKQLQQTKQIPSFQELSDNSLPIDNRYHLELFTRQHLLIPEHQKSSKKNNDEYHLIQIDDDQDDLIQKQHKNVQNIDLL